MKIEYKVGDWVICTVFHNMAMADGSFEPQFYSHTGQILKIQEDGRYQVWGPGGEQYQTVGYECLKPVKENKK